MRIPATAVVFAAVLGFGEPWSCVDGIEPLPDPNAPPPWPAPGTTSVRVDVQMVSIPIAKARVLVPEFQNQQKATAAWARLQEMIAGGKAELLAWPVIWLNTGGSGKSESCLEDRFPTEYTPPQIPQTISVNLPPTPKWGATTPTAFETRNMGAVVSVEAVKIARDGADVELNLVTEFIRPIRIREWRIQRSPLGVEGVATQPDFQTSKLTTSLCAHRDEPLLIGLCVQSEPAPHAELQILHARVTVGPPGVPNSPPK
jgi:general secretion pathway protein D